MLPYYCKEKLQNFVGCLHKESKMKNKRMNLEGRSPFCHVFSLHVPQGLKLTKKSSRNFATRYENLVAILQILVTKLLCCIVFSAV